MKYYTPLVEMCVGLLDELVLQLLPGGGGVQHGGEPPRLLLPLKPARRQAHCQRRRNWWMAVFRIRLILMRIRIRGSASGMKDPGPVPDPDPT